MASEGAERRLVAILFTDIVGYTALMAESEERGLTARERHRDLVRPLVQKYHGESIEARGDESLSVFPSALNAVNCALAIQEKLRDDPSQLRLHLGIHLGEVVLQDGEVSGDGVNIAARIRALSDGEAAYISDEVQHAVQNQPNLEFESLGEHELKNVPRPVSVCRVTGTAQLPRRVSRIWPRPLPLTVRWVAAVVVLLAAVALWWQYRPAPLPGPIRSLAVLPLENLSGDPEQEYFADGMTETLIGELAKLGSLTVISRTSVKRYKQSDKSLPEIAEELGVSGIIEGSVIREADRIRITAQLIDARTDTHLWAESFDRELRGVLALQSDVARAIVEQIHLELTPEDEGLLFAPGTVDPGAYDAYLKGIGLQGPANRIGFWGPPAIAQFERAVGLDPRFAEGWAVLGYARAMLATGESLRAEYPKAREAAERALELDDSLGLAHTVLGMVRVIYDRDFDGSASAYERSVQLSPNDPRVLDALAWALVLGGGRTEEMLAISERLLHVAPLDMSYRADRITLMLLARQPERALAEVERVRELDPDLSHVNMMEVYTSLGFVEEAYRAWVESLGRQGTPFHDRMRETLERGWADGGWRGATLALAGLFAEIEGHSPVYIGGLYASAGETDKALAWYERGYRQRDPRLILLRASGHDLLRADPRFDDLLRRIGSVEPPEDPGMLAGVGYALARHGRAAEALARLERARELSPSDLRLSRWLYYTALAHFAAERYELAIDWVDRAFQQAARDSLAASSLFSPHPHLLLASCYAHLERLDEARGALDEALSELPSDRDQLPIYVWADSTMRGRYLDGLRKAGLLDSPAASMNRIDAGDFNELLGRRTREDNARAQAMAREMAAVVPAANRGWWLLRSVLTQLQALQEGWSDSPSETATQMNRDARSCIELLPSAVECVASTGFAFMIAGEQEQMITAFEHLLALTPGNSRNYGALGYYLALAGGVEEAIAAVEEAMRLAPDSPSRAEWFRSMAMAHFAAERYEEAVVWADRALGADAYPLLSWSSKPDATAILATSHAHLGRLDEAQAALDELLALSPGRANYRADYPLFASWDPDLRDRYLDGLRKAGLPEE